MLAPWILNAIARDTIGASEPSVSAALCAKTQGAAQPTRNLRIAGACLQFNRPHHSGAIHCERTCATPGPLEESQISSSSGNHSTTQRIT